MEREGHLSLLMELLDEVRGVHEEVKRRRRLWGAAGNEALSYTVGTGVYVSNRRGEAPPHSPTHASHACSLAA